MLLAQGLSPSLSRNLDGAIALTVSRENVERARGALLAYERENPPKGAAGREPLGSADSFAASAVAGLLILAFFSITVISNPTMAWFERGSADADKILNGELWRTLTALTLHADVAHALSNATALVLFLGAVGRVLGTGLGCALILMAGVGGNLANALLHGSPHVSVGASTSVFGAVGVLGGLGVVMRRTGALSRRRAWLPVAAAFALLGMLGTGAVVKRPVVITHPELGETIAIRQMVYLALTYDHRLVDGADAARFLSDVKARLETGTFEV